MSKSLNIFINDVSTTIDCKYGFNNIEYLTSFKIVIMFKSKKIEEHTSGKLLKTGLDINNKLFFLTKSK